MTERQARYRVKVPQARRSGTQAVLTPPTVRLCSTCGKPTRIYQAGSGKCWTCANGPLAIRDAG